AATKRLSRRQLHSALRGLEHRGLDMEVRRRRVCKQLPSFLCIRAAEPDDDRQIDLHPVESRKDAARYLVAAGDAAEDVEEDRADLIVACDHLERLHDPLGVNTPADIAGG